MTSRSLYPLFLKLNGARVLVVGGGEICAQKLPPLVHAGAAIDLVAPELCDEVAAAVRRGEATHTKRAFVADDVLGARMVIAATDDSETNRIVYDAAKSAGVLVNVVDVPDLCDFYTGGIVRRGPLTVVIGSSGHAPGLSRALREHLERMLPAALTPLAAAVREGRKRGPALWPTFKERAPRLTQLAREGLYAVMTRGGDDVAPETLDTVTLERAAVVDVDLDKGVVTAALTWGEVFEGATCDVARLARPDAEEIVRVLRRALNTEAGTWRCVALPETFTATRTDSDAPAVIARLEADAFSIVYDALVVLAVL